MSSELSSLDDREMPGASEHESTAALSRTESASDLSSNPKVLAVGLDAERSRRQTAEKALGEEARRRRVAESQMAELERTLLDMQTKMESKQSALGVIRQSLTPIATKVTGSGASAAGSAVMSGVGQALKSSADAAATGGNHVWALRTHRVSRKITVDVESPDGSVDATDGGTGGKADDGDSSARGTPVRPPRDLRAVIGRGGRNNNGTPAVREHLS